MKTLLIKVPYLHLFESMRRTAAHWFPFGLGDISSYMKSQGHDVVLVDPEMQRVSRQALERLVVTNRPALVGLSSVTANFTRRRIHELSDALVHANLGVSWMCWARVNTIQDRETLELMKAAGCVQINLGVETGDPSILKRIKKGTTLEQARRAFELCHETGVKTSAGFIIGFPGETRKSIERTIRFAIELEPDVALFNTLVPLPGAEVFADFPQLHDDRGDAGFWDQFKTASSGGYPVAALPGLSKDQLRLALVEANRRYDLRLGYLTRQLRRVSSLYELRANLVGALELLQHNLKKSAPRLWQPRAGRR